MAQFTPSAVSFATMNTLLKTSLLFAAVVTAGSVFAAAEEKPSPVTVAFHEADKFTDARSSFGGGTDEHYLAILRTHLQETAAKRLAPGQKLEVTFTDVDLAGDFVPSGAGSQDVRIIREIYIPRLKLSFKLLDQDGKVINEGERRLSDLNFMNSPSIIGRNEPLFYDKNLLTDWIRKEFKS